MDQWLKQQPLKRKQEPVQQLLAPNLPRLILQTPEETPTTVTTSVNSVKLLDGMTIVSLAYLPFGFAWCGDENEPKPQCVICSEKRYF